MKRVALARLVVDNVPQIQVDWSLYGPKLAQVALTDGRRRLDGVSATRAGEDGRRRAPLEEVRRNIRAAGQEPVERNGRFDADRMSAVRLGAVGYLNARPLVFGLDRDPASSCASTSRRVAPSAARGRHRPRPDPVD